ncbi:MAG TPA: glycoside hydrolase domain-containing protein, partial [Niastella sp.]
MKYSIWFLVLFIKGVTLFSQTDIQVGFGSVDVRYAKNLSPVITQQPNQAIAWKGERVHLQLLVYTKISIKNLRVTCSALSNGKGHSIPASAITTGFIRYVITDSLNKEGHGCGISQASASDSTLVADGIDLIPQKTVDAFTTQPVWVSVAVPVNTIAGKYNGLLYVHCNGDTRTLSYSIQVKTHTLPPPAQWSFHLDLWQNPYAVARIYGVKEWSKEHFDHLRPYMQWLAAAGQKTITVSMIH